MKTGDTKQFQEIPKKGRKWGIPVRYVMTILGFLGFFSISTMKVTLSVALVAMTSNTTDAQTTASSFNRTNEFSKFFNQSSVEAISSKEKKYNWDSKTQSLILGAFFCGNILTQFPSGIIAEKYSAKWLFGGGILMTAIFSLITPISASWGIAAFVTMRVVEGVGEGLLYPSSNVLISKWAPKYERSLISSIFFTGCDIGNVIALPLSGFLCSSDLFGGWPSAFYIFGITGCLWFPFWIYFVTDTPEEHKQIALEERDYIQESQENQKEDKPHKNLPIPWKSIFTSVPVLALSLTHFGFAFGFFVILTELPSYLSKVLHFDIRSGGLLSALPYLLQAIASWTASYIADKIRKSDRLQITTIRKIFNSIGLFGPAVCLLAVTVSDCRSGLIVGLISLAMACSGFCCAGFNVTHIDMSPDFAGTLYGITNTVANTCGILGPAVVEIITSQENSIIRWNYVFYLTATIYIISGLIFLVFGTADLQPWGIVDEPVSEKNMTNGTKIYSYANNNQH